MTADGPLKVLTRQVEEHASLVTVASVCDNLNVPPETAKRLLYQLARQYEEFSSTDAQVECLVCWETESGSRKQVLLNSIASAKAQAAAAGPALVEVSVQSISKRGVLCDGAEVSWQREMRQNRLKLADAKQSDALWIAPHCALLASSEGPSVRRFLSSSSVAVPHPSASSPSPLPPSAAATPQTAPQRTASPLSAVPSTNVASSAVKVSSDSAATGPSKPSDRKQSSSGRGQTALNFAAVSTGEVAAAPKQEAAAVVSDATASGTAAAGKRAKIRSTPDDAPSSRPEETAVASKRRRIERGTDGHVESSSATAPAEELAAAKSSSSPAPSRENSHSNGQKAEPPSSLFEEDQGAPDPAADIATSAVQKGTSSGARTSYTALEKTSVTKTYQKGSYFVVEDKEEIKAVKHQLPSPTTPPPPPASATETIVQRSPPSAKNSSNTRQPSIKSFFNRSKK